VRILSRMSFRPVNEVTGGGHSLRSLRGRVAARGLGQTEDAVLFQYMDLEERIFRTKLVDH